MHLACVKRNEQQLDFVNSEIRGLINNIGDASHSAWEANRELQHWIGQSEIARKKAVKTAQDSLFKLAKHTLFAFSRWRHPPVDAGPVKKAFINNGRVLGFFFRKYEMDNPRFLKYAEYALEGMEGMEGEERLNNAQSLDDYIHATGKLTEAMAGLAGGYARQLVDIKHTIALGESDYDIWKDDLYAYWVVVMTVYKSKSDLEIPAQQLKNIALWSGMLHTEMAEKRRLMAQLDDCQKTSN